MRRLSLSLWLALLAVGASGQEVFRIQPVRPVEELRREALQAQPPQQEKAGKRASELVELIRLDATIKLDIRYATSNNFLSTPVYEQARAFLQCPAAQALVRAHQALQKQGYGLLIHDAYRPWYVSKIFWEATPDHLKKFVADPSKGSNHNRGCAVDLTLYDLKTGQPVEMPSLYDEMSERSYPDYKGGTEEQRRLRDLLRSAMEAEGFKVYEWEWWHFNYKDCPEYLVENVAFDEIPFTLCFADRAFRVGVGGVKPPKGIYTPDPEYSVQARKEGRQGTVRLDVVIGADGRVQEARVVRSLSADLDQQALKAVRSWRFRPATLDGKPVPVQVQVDVNFRLY